MKSVFRHVVYVERADGSTTQYGPAWWYFYWMPHTSCSCDPQDVYNSVKRDLNFHVLYHPVDELAPLPKEARR